MSSAFTAQRRSAMQTFDHNEPLDDPPTYGSDRLVFVYPGYPSG